jgi:hypothetical protein
MIRITALLVAACNLAYATSFLIVRPDNPETGGTAASALLLAGGLLALPVLLHLYRSLAHHELALLGAVLAIAGALGAAIHGGYDLANAIHAPSTTLDTPNAVDPRGLLTFGAAGLALLVFAPLLNGKRFKLHTALLGLALLTLYALRLTVLDAGNPAVVATAALTGFILSPLWYVSYASSARSASAESSAWAPLASTHSTREASAARV